MAFGTVFGVGIGAATDNWGVWLPIGVAVGLAVGIGVAAATRPKTPQ
jgi:hypothetical protein